MIKGMIMGLKEKSEENEKTARLAAKKGCYNVAVSRYYYAVLQRMLHYLKSKNVDFEKFENTNTSHKDMKEEFFKAFNLNYWGKDKDKIRQSINYFITLKKMRVKADYKIEHITDAEYHNNLKNNILKLLMNLKKVI